MRKVPFPSAQKRRQERIPDGSLNDADSFSTARSRGRLVEKMSGARAPDILVYIRGNFSKSVVLVLLFGTLFFVLGDDLVGDFSWHRIIVTEFLRMPSPAARH